MRRAASTIGIGALVLSSAFVMAPAAHAAPPVETAQYLYSGNAAALFIVPVGVTSIDYAVTGGPGGKGGGINGGVGGAAHVATGTLSVTAGQVLEIYVAEPGAVGLNADDTENGTPTIGLPGDGGWGYTSGGDGGFGSLLSRPGGGGGGSSAIVVQGESTPVVVGAGGGGGGGRGIFGFCFGGTGGAGDVNGGAGISAPDCLIPGVGGLVDQGLDGNGTDGGDVILFGGGGGGGGAGALGQGGGGGFAGAHPGVPVNMGAGGGGGAGGGSLVTGVGSSVSAADPSDPAEVVLTFSPSYATSLTPTVVGTPGFGDDVEISVAVANTTAPSIPVNAGSVTLSDDGTVLDTADVVNGVALLDLGELPAGELEYDLAYVPQPISAFEASTAEGSVVIAKTAIALDVSTAPNPNVANVGVVVTAEVAGVSPVGPSGGLVLFVDGVAVQTVILDGELAATVAFDALTLAVGDHDIEVLYEGDGNYFSELSDTLVQRTSAAPAALPNTGVEASGVVIGGSVLLVVGLGMLAARRIRARRSTLTP